MKLSIQGHYAETSRQNKTACTHEHQEEESHNKRTATSHVLKLNFYNEK